MDEPFGAIDPLNRAALQNEFLRIQSDLRKTIVFVTHDIDEAIKMGDRIAIFREGGTVAQYDTPENILAEPADAFVADFLGTGTAVKRLSLTTLESVPVPRWPAARADMAGDEQAALAQECDEDFLPMLDAHGRPSGWMPREAAGARAAGAEMPLLTRLGPTDTLFAALDAMLSHNSSATVVVDEHGGYRGVLELDSLRELLNTRTATATRACDELQEM